MCTRCNDIDFVPTESHDEDPIDRAAIFENPNSPDSILTTNSMDVGDTFYGTRATSQDDDYIEVTLEAGKTYEFSMDGSTNFRDTYLYLLNSSGSTVASDDDDGPGLYSQLTYTATYSGSYFIRASAYVSHTGTGDYTVTVQEDAPPDPSKIGTLDELANFLTEGYWNSTGRAGRAYDISSDNIITVDISGLTAGGQQLARWAFEAWELVANVDFVESSGTVDMRFDDEASGAYASSSTFQGRILSSNINVSKSWLSSYGTSIDSYSFQTYVHEIGHALGLGHQGAYNGAATYGVDETFANDSWQVSIMSYFSQNENTETNASYAFVSTAMMADIVAIQNLYGASTATAGNDTWGGRNATTGTYLDGLFNAFAGGSSPSGFYNNRKTAVTISDHSGIDTIDFSYSNSNDNLNLASASFSDVDGRVGNVGIARGTVIENLMTGSGSDQIAGNDVANAIQSNLGNDTIEGLGGNDTIDAGGGNDSVKGDGGADNITGAEGADTLLGGGGNDTVSGGSDNDLIQGGGGRDNLTGDGGNDTIWAGGHNDSVNGGNGFDRLGGWEGDDTILGGNDGDIIFGGDGQDSLDGQSGDDTVWGGNGDDFLKASDGNDKLGGGAGNDTVLGSDGDNIMFGGTGNDLLQGGGGADTIEGSRGFDTIEAGAGDDLVAGGKNNDTISGGTGNDTISGGEGYDSFVFAAGDGGDTVLDFTLGGDRLVLDDNLWQDTLTRSQVVATFAATVTDGVQFSFAGGESLLLSGLTSTTGLEDALTFI